MTFLVEEFWPDVRVERWQMEPLRKIEAFLLSKKEREAEFISIVGAHGTGKTTLLAWTIVMAVVVLGGRNVNYKGSVYSGKWTQLTCNLWKEVGLWLSKYEHEHTIDFNQKHIRLAWQKQSIDPKSYNVQDIQRSAGQHADVSLIFIDEATAVPTELIDKLNGSTTDPRILWVMAANPDKNFGYIYDIHMHNRAFWQTYSVSHKDLTFQRSIDYEERTLRKYGEDSDRYCVQVLGVFPVHNSTSFIPRMYIEAAQERAPPQGVPLSFPQMGIDVATGEGSDFSTIVIRSGAIISYVERKKVLLTEAKYWIMGALDRFGITTFAIDMVGIGAHLYQDLRKSYNVVGVNGSEKPKDTLRFYNLRAELYEKLREWILHVGRLPRGGDYDELIRELGSLEATHIGTRCLMRSKKEMKTSPDFADALAYTFAIPEIPVDSRFSRGGCGRSTQPRIVGL